MNGRTDDQANSRTVTCTTSNVVKILENIIKIRLAVVEMNRRRRFKVKAIQGTRSNKHRAVRRSCSKCVVIKFEVNQLTNKEEIANV